MWEIALDSVVISLLSVTIYFCWRLNERISELRNSKKDLLELVKTFDEAIKKTNANVSELKTMSRTSTQELQNYIQRATELIGDLSFLTDSASEIANRLEDDIKTAKLLDSRPAPANLNKVIRSIDNVGAPPSPPPASGIGSLKAGFAKTKDEFLAAIRSSKR